MADDKLPPNRITPDQARRMVEEHERRWRELLDAAVQARGDAAASLAGDAIADKAALKPQLAGEDVPKPRSRARQGRAVVQGADRAMKFYKVLEPELAHLGELGRDASTAFGWMAFCAGFLANIVVGMLFATGITAETRAVGFALGGVFLLAAVKFYVDGSRKRRTEKTEFERIKEAHDFEKL